MNFKKFDSIGDSEPRAWSQSIGTKFGKEEDDEDEVPVPYCDESDEEEESEDEESEDEEETVTETETDTDSVGSKKSKNPLKRTRQTTVSVISVVLQEELDFMAE
jgi:hypothetical protein